MATDRHTDSYLLITVESAAEAMEAAAVALTDLGADGVIEEATDRGCRVKAYFSAADWPRIKPGLLERLERVRRYFPSLRLVEESPAEAIDWTEAWKKFHHPITVGRLWVGPPWQIDQAPAGTERLIIDPGQAFGTGAHASTRLCLEAIVGAAESEAPPKTVLDIGTGSGVLALAALKLGAGTALGLDTDPLALEAAAQNAEANGLADRLDLSGRLVETVTDRFPLVLANLTGPLHLALADHIADRVAPGGRLVASGILIEEAEAVIEAYQPGLGIDRVRRLGEWAGLIFSRPESGD